MPTPTDLLTVQRQATERALARGPHDWIGPAALAAQLEPKLFVRRPHSDAMNRALQALLTKPGGALMITSPPQVGKSTMVSQWLPVWWLTMRPADRVVLGCYSEALALRNSLAARNIFAAYGDQFGLTLTRDQATKSDWTLNTTGGMIARGVGGSITGFSMNLGIIDDPIKDRAAAESDVIRTALWDWYSSVWLTRRAPDARELVTMTRWRKDDLAGRILDEEGRVDEGGRWTVLHLPAFALTEDRQKGIGPDPLGRAPGEPLTHPRINQRNTLALTEHWERARKQSTARDWNAMYQGVPFDAEGALLTEQDIADHTADPPTEFRRVAIGVDPAGGGRDTVGIVAAGLDLDGRVWWLADRTRRMTALEWPRTVCLLAQELGADRVVVETNYGGDMATTAVTQAWAELAREGRVAGLCPLVHAVKARQSKVLRAEPIAQAIRTGRAWFARGAPLHQFTTEWQMWTPGSTWSPGALDAGVHVATDLLPTIHRGPTGVVSPARIHTTTQPRGSVAARRRNG